MAGRTVILSAVGMVVVVLAGGLAFAHRRVKAIDPVAGDLTTYFSWGRVARIESDRNRDGRIDGKEIYQPPIAWRRAAAVSPSEAWLDQDFDGIFELEVKMSRGGELLSLGMDSDGDGTFERVLTGDVAAEEMKRVRERNAEIIEQYGTWKKTG